MIPYLHEFGGTLKLKTWAFIPQIKTLRGGMKSPIIMKLPAGQMPRDQSRWRPMRSFEHKSTTYPARPFMKPAMEFCISNGSIARAGVPGLRTIPHWQPSWRIRASVPR